MRKSRSSRRSGDHSMEQGVRSASAVETRRPGRLALAGCLALAAVFSWRTDASYDTGFHLATGRWILAHHAWPRLDPFTYTVPDRWPGRRLRL